MSIGKRIFGLSSSNRGRRRALCIERFPCEQLEVRELLAASLNVLADINSGSGSSLPSADFPSPTTIEFKGNVYFNANDGTHGSELWRTDGSSIGTSMFMDILSGSGASFPADFFVNEDLLYFSAFTSPSTRSLLVTDGTIVGTTVLTTSKAGVPIGALGNTVIFYNSAVSQNIGDFWKSDGTVNGTERFQDGFVDGGFGESVVYDGKLFFSADTGTANKVIWTTDGTDAGTLPTGFVPASVGEFTVVGSSLYFVGKAQGSTNSILWKMTSSTSAPVQVQEPTSNSIAVSPKNLTGVSGALYFSAQSPFGEELWRSNGTSAGTFVVSDVNPGATGSAPGLFTAVDETLFFVATTAANGTELWRSNGTNDSTFMVLDNVAGSGSGGPRAMFSLLNILVFSARTPTNAATNFWTSNGTETGTTRFGDLTVSQVNNFVMLGDKLLFAAENSTAGRELFVFTPDTAALPTMLTTPAAGAVLPELRPLFQWATVAGAQQSEVWIRNRSTGADRQLVTPVTGTSFVPPADLGIGLFTAWIRTLGGSGQPSSAWSLPRNFRIKAPVIQNAVQLDPQTNLPTVSWQPLSGAVRYEVTIDRVDVPQSQVFRTTNVTSTSLLVNTLPAGRYRVWVRGFAADGADGVWSAHRDFQTTPLPAFTGGFNPGFDTTPTLTWSAVPGASSYELYVLSISGNFRILHERNISGLSFTVPAFTPGPYRYWVKATGSTTWSTPVELDTRGRTALLSPLGSTSDTTPLFSWQTVSGVERYELWVDQIGVREKIIYQTNLVEAQFNSSSVLPVGNYRVWVRAISSSSPAPWSMAVDFSIV